MDVGHSEQTMVMDRTVHHCITIPVVMADTSCRHPVAAVSAGRSPAAITVAGSATIQNQGQCLRLHFTLKWF